MKQNIKLVELSQMKEKKNNQFIDPAMFPSIAGLLGAKNHAKAWLDRETAIKFSKLYFSGLSKIENKEDFLLTDCQENPAKGPGLCPGASVGCRRCLKCWNKKIKEIDFKKH